jgi:hypothetical protein
VFVHQLSSHEQTFSDDGLSGLNGSPATNFSLKINAKGKAQPKPSGNIHVLSL